jgi:peptidoglycan/LPS O-acetylase OafA/YrhL
MGRMNLKRLDIQVYRALAVIAVVLYHTNQTGFRYLYLGVDVFFVISGYLMTILYLDTPYKTFIKKRIKRLAPSLILITSIFWFFATIQTIPFELKRIYLSLMSSYVGMSNYYFASQQSYFDSTNYQPFLHLWSLSLEIQFYTIAPALFLLYRRYGLKSVILLTFISFATYVTVFTFVSEKIAFFSMFTRIWEFGFGVLAGLFFKRNSIKAKVIPQVLFILLLAIALIWIYPISQQAEILRVMICLLMSALLLVERKAFFANKIISPLVFIGNISYEVYLVHFPLKAVINYSPLTSNSSQVVNTFLSFLIYVTGTLLLSFFVHELVRRLTHIDWIKVSLCLVLLMFLISSLITFRPNLFYSTNEINSSKSLESYDKRRCDWSSRLTSFTSEICPVLKLEESDGKILLLGDSFANSLKPLIKHFALLKNHDLYLNENNSRLIEDSWRATFEAARKREINLIIFHSAKNVSQQELSSIDQIQKLEKNPYLVIIQPTPIFPFSVGKQVVAQSRESSTQRNIYPKDLVNYSDLTNPLELNREGISYIEIVTLLCPNNCLYANRSGQAFYFDSSHITSAGLKLINPILQHMEDILEKSVTKK